MTWAPTWAQSGRELLEAGQSSHTNACGALPCPTQLPCISLPCLQLRLLAGHAVSEELVLPQPLLHPAGKAIRQTCQEQGRDSTHRRTQETTPNACNRLHTQAHQEAAPALAASPTLNSLLALLEGQLLAVLIGGRRHLHRVLRPAHLQGRERRREQGGQGCLGCMVSSCQVVPDLQRCCASKKTDSPPQRRLTGHSPAACPAAAPAPAHSRGRHPRCGRRAATVTGHKDCKRGIGLSSLGSE